VNEPQADISSPSGPSEHALDRALALVEFLRARCPWDAQQTHGSLRRYLLEEAHEVVDAIDARDDDALRDELGDLLLNLAFQIVIAEERGVFDRESVTAGLEEKMRRRHPHLYGGDPHESWEAAKAAERGAGPQTGSGSLLDDLVAGSDPLTHARALQARVATVGFDWPDWTGAWQKVLEEVREVEEHPPTGPDANPALEEELGDLLFAIVNFARLAGVHPSLALARANAKFERRFRRLESMAQERGVQVSSAGLAALDRLWDDVKVEER
jgi:nucleoside triphosphate diphosphatase